MKKAQRGGGNAALPRAREMREMGTTLLELLDLAIPEARTSMEPHFNMIV